MPEQLAITFDLWNTLIFLDDNERQEYAKKRFILAQYVSRRQPESTAGEPKNHDLMLLEQLQLARLAALSAARKGVTITPEDQVGFAARRSGLVCDLQEYLLKLEALIQSLPIKVTPHILEVLAELKGHGFLIGVISNTIDEPGRLIRPICGKLGLSRYIDVFTFSDELPWTKPSPRIFDMAHMGLGVPARSTFHVGDSALDLLGARRARCKAAILYTGMQDRRSVLKTALRFSQAKFLTSNDSRESRLPFETRLGLDEIGDWVRLRIGADYVIRDMKELPGVLTDSARR